MFVVDEKGNTIDIARLCSRIEDELAAPDCLPKQ